MKSLRTERLKYHLTQKCSLSSIKFWLKDIKNSRERCQWCGNYLAPWLVYKECKVRPMKMVPWKEPGGERICSSCHYLNEKLKKHED